MLSKAARGYLKTFSHVILRKKKNLCSSLSNHSADQNAVLRKRNIVQVAIKFYEPIITDMIVQGYRGL